MSKTMSFEEAMERLEEIARGLENGTMTLDESIKAYEEAIKLIKTCNERLESAEAKVRILTEMKDGSVTDVDFTGSNED